MTESSEFSPETASNISPFQEKPLMPEKETEIVDKIRHWDEKFAELADEPARDILNQTEAIRDEHLDLEKETVKTMADSDPEIREKQDALEGLAKTLRRIHEDADQGNWLNDAELKEKLEVFSDVIALVQNYQQSQAARSIASPVKQISLPLSTHSLPGVTAAVEKLTTLCEDPRTIWHHLVEQNVVTAEFIEEKDLITDLLLMKKQQDLIEENKHLFTNEQIRALRAKTLAPLLDKNINLVLLDEALEGRFVFEEDFAKETISAFLSFKEETEEPLKKPKRKLTKKEKMARAAVIGMLSGMLLLPGSSFQHPETMIEPPKLARELETEELFPSKPEIEGPSLTSNRPDFDYNAGLTPEMDSPEAFKRAAETKYWELGKTMLGRFREATAAKFQGELLNWRKDHSVGFQAERIESQQPETIMRGFGNKALPEVELAVPYGYRVNPDHSKVFIDGQLLKPTQDYYIEKALDNDTFTLGILKAHERQGEVELQIALNKTSENDFPKDDLKSLDKQDMANLTEKHLQINQLPQTVQDFISQLQEGDFTTEQKAQAVEKFIQENLIYALEPKWSQYYLQAKSPTEFFNRILAIGKADCDTANTELVLLLRELDLPCRLAMGFNNTGFFLDQDSKILDGAEKHAWVEYYDAEKEEWGLLDGTPIRIDKETFEKIKDGLSLGFGLPKNWQEFQEALKLELYLLKDLVRDHKVAVAVGLAGLQYALTGFALKKITNRIERTNQDIHQTTRDVIEHRLATVFKNQSSGFRESMQRFINCYPRYPSYDEYSARRGPFLAISSLKEALRKRRLTQQKEQIEEAQTSEDMTPMDFITHHLDMTDDEATTEIVKYNTSDTERNIEKVIEVNAIQALAATGDQRVITIIYYKTPWAEIIRKAESPEDAVQDISRRLFAKINGVRKRRELGIKEFRPFLRQPLPDIPRNEDEFSELLIPEIERPITVLWHALREKEKVKQRAK